MKPKKILRITNDAIVILQIMDALMEVLSRIQPLHRGKDARVSQERRLAAQDALNEGDLTKALALSSQAVLRAPVTGNT